MRRFGTILAALALVGLACTGESDTSTSSDATTTTDPNEESSILAVQNAQSATFDGAGETFTLTMEGADETTVWFTDRPARRAGTLSTVSMLEKMFDPDDPDGPPNAAMVWPSDEGQSVLAVELTSGSYDEESGTLTYEARALARHDGGLTHSGPSAEIPTGPVGPVTAFVDSIFAYEICELDVTNKIVLEALGWTQTAEDGSRLTGGKAKALTTFSTDQELSWSWEEDTGHSCKATVNFYEGSYDDDAVISLHMNNPDTGSNSLTVSCSNYTCATKTLHNATTYHMAVVLCADGVSNDACLAMGGY